MADKQIPVLIAGGGSVGLATALFLADQGVPVLVVEAAAGPSVHPRATGVGARTVEMLRAVGLQEAVNAVSVDMTGGGLGKAHASTLAETDFAALPVITPPAKAWSDNDVSPGRLRGTCPQHRLDSVVLPAARERGAQVRYSTRVVSFTQDAEGVRAVLDSGEVVSAAYLIAADGVRSEVREALDIGVTGPGPLGKPMVSMLFHADLTPYLQGRQFATCNIDNPDVHGMLVTVDGEKEWILHTECTDNIEEFTDQRCRELIRAAVGDGNIEVEVVSVLPWRPRGLLADRFQQGRVFLVGDAAHAVPPMGAFGLNTGIADGHNLAWKLAAVLAGRAGAGLLDTYTAERHPVAVTACDQALRRFADPRLHWGTSPDIVAARIAGGILNAPVVHMGYRYDSAAIIDPKPELPSTEDISLVLDGSPGSRLPHRWIEHDGQRQSTLDLVGPGFTVLTASPQWERAAREASEALDCGLTVRRIDLGDNDWLRSVGIGADGAVLVRPDQFIAWRVPTLPPHPETELARVLRRILARD